MKPLHISILSILCLALFYVAIPLPKPLFPNDYSTVVLGKDGQILRVFLNQAEQWHLPPAPQHPIPQKLKTAVLHFEDRRFEHHIGIDPLALARALYQNITQQKVISGASTLTMQVARLMNPKKRTYANKALEILQALKIETQYAKTEILHTYLNHAPYGGNIVGYRAASHRYFQKDPAQLTWSQAALLAVLPNAPGILSPQANPTLLHKKRDQLLDALYLAHHIDEETLRLSKQEPIPNQAHPFPMLAPHLAQHCHTQNPGNIVHTTIDATIQTQAQELVARHVEHLRHSGIHNGLALIADTQTGQIVAYVGSQNFNEHQIDGIVAPRSSGSLLKPFLYALSIDAGLIMPQSQLRDIPTYYGPFSPRNANRTYSGLTTAHDALITSANVPAVRLLYTYGLAPFYQTLKAAGLTTLFRSPQDYGLPLIIGGAEVNALEMAALFRGLANNGTFHPLTIHPSDTPPQTPQLISPGACHLILNSLRDLARPGSEYYWHQYQNQWPIAWKTGTSYGHRDAWAVGVSPQWTIAVWVGNFNGDATPDLIGSRCAGPLFFDLFNSLPKDPTQPWFAPPETDLTTITLCAETGYQASIHCPTTTQTEAPKHQHPLQTCPNHQTITVTQNETQRVCSLCWTPNDHKRVSRLIYTPDVVTHLRQQGHIASDLPPHNPNCPAQADQSAIKIVYPTPNAHLYLPRDLDGTLQNVVLRATHRDKDHTLYWYVNHHYLGETKTTHTKATPLPEGWHTLEVVDEMGQRDQTRFYIASKQKG